MQRNVLRLAIAMAVIVGLFAGALYLQDRLSIIESRVIHDNGKRLLLQVKRNRQGEVYAHVYEGSNGSYSIGLVVSPKKGEPVTNPEIVVQETQVTFSANGSMHRFPLRP